jgi:hypothetical protein
MLNGNGNGHASFDEEKPLSHRRGFFADQFEVSEPVSLSQASQAIHVNMARNLPAEPQQL